MKCVLLFLLFLIRGNFAFYQLFDHQKVFQITPKVSQKSFNDELCQNQLTQFTQALANNEDWAVRLTDTWAKIMAGYLSGNSMNLGDFDSCVRFRHESIQGQFCWVTFSALPNSTLESDRIDLSLRKFANFLRNNQIVTTNGFCLPASCSTENVVQFLNQQILFRNDLIAYGAQCSTNDLSPLDPIDYFAIVFFTLIALLIIASTSYEIILKHRGIDANRLLISFSVYTNGAKLYDVTKIKSASSLNCLHGLRAMSIFWIILGHRFYNQYPWGNINEFIEFNETILSAVVRSHPIAVDTFFVMGAVLMTWTTLRDCEKKNLNILRMIWRRYLRYTPAYAAVILVVISFGKYMLRESPYQHIGETLRDPCVKKWWMVLLHIQNYLPGDKMCLNHGWYLSADFQLFLISPFIIWLIHKFGKKLLTLPAVLCFGCIIFLLSISFIYDIRTTSNDYLKYIYFKTHARAGPWFIGMILGYFLYVNRGKVIKINKWINAMMWIISLSTFITIILLEFALANNEASLAAHAFFIAFQRNIWAVSICWIIFACQHLKTGGIIRWFLSLPQWQPISRMGLSMYLIGAVYQVLMILNQRVPLFLNFWQVIPTLWSDIAMIIILGTFSYLAFEAPPIIIEEYFYKKYQVKKLDKKLTAL